MRLIDFDVLGNQTSSSVQLAQGKAVRAAFSDVITFRNANVCVRDLEESAMTKVLEKWYLIFSTGLESWPNGFDLRAAVRNHRLEDIRSHGTILRRG